jgi:hypothetical protein
MPSRSATVITAAGSALFVVLAAAIYRRRKYQHQLTLITTPPAEPTASAAVRPAEPSAFSLTPSNPPDPAAPLSDRAARLRALAGRVAALEATGAAHAERLARCAAARAAALARAPAARKAAYLRDRAARRAVTRLPGVFSARECAALRRAVTRAADARGGWEARPLYARARWARLLLG